MTEILRSAPWPNVVGCQNIPRTSDVVNAYAGSVHSDLALQAKVHELPVGTPVADTLSHFVRHIPAGLMVMGIYGPPWYRDLLFGSVSRTVLARVPSPLFSNHFAVIRLRSASTGDNH